MEETKAPKRDKYIIPKGSYYRRLPRNITIHIHEMEDFGIFLKAIGTYTHLLNYTYGEYRTNDFYIGILHQIRMMIDVLCKCTAFYLTDSKDTFLSRFIKDKCVNNQKKDGKQLTTNVTLDYLENRYTGIREVYDECNRYVHPSIFFYRRYKDSGSWFTSIRNLNEQKKVFDFFFDVSNQILVEILTDAFNTYAVPKYGLEPIEAKKRYKRTLAYTTEALDVYKPRKYLI
jgi:hypothetical protein